MVKQAVYDHPFILYLMPTSRNFWNIYIIRRIQARFSNVHGEIWMGIFNKGTKAGSGTSRIRFSTNTDTVSTRVNVVNIHNKLLLGLHQQLQLKISSKPKESTHAGITKHMKNVDALKTTLWGYGFDPFQNTALREISTGSEVDKNILYGMIRVDDKRDRQTSGVIVFKSIGKEDAFAHPLTSVPLTVATSERELR